MQSLSDISIQYVKGVGPHKKKLFQNLGVETVEDLMYFFPKRYEDRRRVMAIAQLTVGEWQTVRGKVFEKVARKSWHTKKHVVEIILDDGTGRIVCSWFNQPYQISYFQPGEWIVCYGKVDMYKSRLQMVAPEYEIIDGDEQESLGLNRIVPMYPLTKGMTQRFMRKIIKACLDKYHYQLTDELPVSLRNKYRLSNIKRSIMNLHFPEDFSQQEEALKRVSFEEFFFFQVSIILRRLSIVQKQGVAHSITDADTLRFINGFGFELTQAQKNVIREIRDDMKRNTPMLRLLQGDVGSGKTLVALFGCLVAFHNSTQSAIMVPTEILARQHFDHIERLVRQGPLQGMKVALLINQMKPTEKNVLYEQMRDGEIDLVIGTHSLITDHVQFKNLSYVVIDEQHKFGVRQRALLTEKGTNPDVLIMTATPIPRTLCISLYGDMDVSVLDELPLGRGTVKTFHYSHEQSREVYKMVKENVAQGGQAYIVYPVIEESEKTDLKAAEDMYKRFQKNEFRDFKIGLVHGQMKQLASRQMMDGFKEGKIDVLVATTVLEVGIDVPNATVMVVEHAERFGLAQLHQLRGRIGRGGHEGYCFLIADPQTEEGQMRIKAILSTTDGFKIAQEDLMIRGPGRFFGRHQHGLNELKVANPATQLDVLELARQEAMEILKEDPLLKDSAHIHIKSIITKRYPTYLSMVTAG